MHLDAGGPHVETAPGLMFGQHASDVVVHHHHLVGLAEQLLGEDADGGGAATDAHAFFLDTVDDGRSTGLYQDLGAALNRERHRLLVAQRLHHFDRHPPLFLAATGEVMHTAQRKHLRAVLGGCHVANDLALAAHRSLLRSQKTVGIDLYLQAAVAEDALGHHRHRINARHRGRNNERRWLVVGVGG